MNLRKQLASWLGGTSVIVLGDDEAAVVFSEHDRSPRGLYLARTTGDDLGPGSSLAAALFVAARAEPGRLVAVLDQLESVKAVS